MLLKQPGRKLAGPPRDEKSTIYVNPSPHWRTSLQWHPATFFEAYPHLEGQVVVHHGVEQQVLTKYAGRFTPAEIHSLENLRGIPKSINADLHLSKIRMEWNKFYRQFDAEGISPSKEQLLDKATEIDNLFGSQFTPPIGG